MTAPSKLPPGLLCSQSRIDAATRERSRYDAFCQQYRLVNDPDTVTLWLTRQHDLHPNLSGSGLRFKLRLLDIAAVLHGEPEPSKQPPVRAYLKGLHREVPIANGRRAEPLYTEMVQAMLDAIDRDHLPQSRDIAMLLLANATGLSAEALRLLTWDQIQIRQGVLLVDVPQRPHTPGPYGRLTLKPGRPPCVVEAFRELRRQAGATNGYVFNRFSDGPPALGSLKTLLWQLPGRGPGDDRPKTPLTPARLRPLVADLSRPRVRELRDRAMLGVAFSACLTNRETSRLRHEHVTLEPRGLTLLIAGRHNLTVIPRSEGARYCPVRAWESWAQAMAADGKARPGDPAFPNVHRTLIMPTAAAPERLMLVVQARAQQAGLLGDYSYASLRVGFMRSAARAEVRSELIARQAGLRFLSSVLTHENRERLISHSVAGSLGL